MDWHIKRQWVTQLRVHSSALWNRNPFQCDIFYISLSGCSIIKRWTNFVHFVITSLQCLWWSHLLQDTISCSKWIKEIKISYPLLSYIFLFIFFFVKTEKINSSYKFMIWCYRKSNHTSIASEKKKKKKELMDFFLRLFYHQNTSFWILIILILKSRSGLNILYLSNLVSLIFTVSTFYFSSQSYSFWLEIFCLYCQILFTPQKKVEQHSLADLRYVNSENCEWWLCNHLYNLQDTQLGKEIFFC